MVVKNYLRREEIETLNRIVTASLELAELQALNRKPMTMVNWITRLDNFLTLPDREILMHAGKISHGDAKEKPEVKLVRFERQQAASPLPLNDHFEQALDGLKQIETQAKSPKQKAARISRDNKPYGH